MPLTAPTGPEIVQVRSSTDQVVGAYSAADVTADTASKTPNSPSEESAVWINALTASLGALSSAQTLYATRAMRWHSWLYYWKLSRYGDVCAAECADDASYYKKESFATKQICHYLDKLGVTDPEFCNTPEAGYAQSNYIFTEATELN
jgi:hypothetical protein